MARRRLTDEERRYNLEHKQVLKVNGHWMWLGALHKGMSRNGYGPYGETGYGQICIRGETILAHRYSYILFKGPIPEGCVVDQICNLKLCVNPDCLEAKTQGENVQRYYRECHNATRGTS